jgi:hypothetical protein
MELKMKKIIDTHLYKILNKKNSKFLSNINLLIDYCEKFLPNITLVFQNYTKHDIEHSYNVIQYMYHLVEIPENLTEYDIAMCIYSALLHDIGMVSNAKEIDDIKKDIIKIGGRRYSKVLSRVNNENLALQEMIRPYHAIRSKEHIINMKRDLFLIPGSEITFQEEVANICLSHNYSPEWIKDRVNLEICSLKGEYEGNPAFVAILLRLSDFLDIDSNRTPLDLFNYLHMNNFGFQEWKMNMSIENTCDNKIKSVDGIKEIVLSGKTSNANIHRKLINYIDYLNTELEFAIDYTRKFEKKYRLNIFPKVKELIKIEGFSFSNHKLQLDYNSITNLLMGEHIYGDKKYGLRELLQNSIDACKLMEEIAPNIDYYKEAPFEPTINIVFDDNENIVSLSDNGIGMTLNTVKNNFLNVGVSYYTSNNFVDSDFLYKPIGKYGIGFLSCFMLSDQINVKTKHYNESGFIEMSLVKNSEFVTISLKNDFRNHGTKIELCYSDFFKVFRDISEVTSFINTNFYRSTIKINIVELKNNLNVISPLELTHIDEIKYNIDLSSYLDQIEVKLSGKFANTFSIQKLSEINSYDCYTYYPELYILGESDNDKIINYVDGDKIYAIKAYIVSSDYADELNKYYDVLEDMHQAIIKTDHNVINIFNSDKDVAYYTRELNYDDDIIGLYNISDFEEQFDHVPGFGTFIEEQIINIINIGTDDCLIYSSDKEKNWRWFGRSGRNYDRIYIRNVFIAKAQIEIPHIIQGINIDSFYVNIYNQKIFPELSRNEINSLILADINLSLGKALHLWILDNLPLNAIEVKLIKEFIRQKYPKTEFCIK